MKTGKSNMDNSEGGNPEGRRALKRRHLIYYLEVYDEDSDKFLGHLVDITTQGIKLVSKKPIETEKIFSLRMNLPEGYFDDKVLTFKAKSLWSGNDVNPDFFDTGFMAPNLDPKAKETITDLVNQLGFND